MSTEGPKPYPVVYDTINGLQYIFQSGAISIATDNNAITALTGDVTATGPGSVAATISNAAVIAKVLTGYVSGAGTVAATDSILQAIQKLNGNQGNYLPLTGGTLSGPIITGSGVQPTQAADIVVSDSTLSALALTGKAIDGSTSTDGVLMYLMHNGSNNRQFAFVDSAGGMTSEPAIRFVLNSGSPAIDVYDANLGSVGNTPLTLGNATNGIKVLGPLIQSVVAVAGTGTVTPTAAQKIISIPVSGNVTLNGPTGGYDGQALTIRVVNDGSHSVTLATGSGNYSFGTTITSYTNSTSTIDYIGVIYNSSASRWHVVSLSQGF